MVTAHHFRPRPTSFLRGPRPNLNGSRRRARRPRAAACSRIATDAWMPSTPPKKARAQCCCGGAGLVAVNGGIGTGGKDNGAGLLLSAAARSPQAGCG